jgi:hypothetical protein
MDEIAAQVVRPLATTASNVVADAFRLVVAPEEQYDESEVAIEQLEFASFAVGGLAAAAEQPLPGTVRSSSRVDIPLSDSAGGTAAAGLRVTLFGPGDVRGIEQPQIVRRYPAPGTLTAEETVLAHIEFDRPELPWAFSAAPPVGALRPWLTLIVVERASAAWEPASGLLPVLQVALAQLPPLGDVHLWAHAQSAQAANGASLAVRMSPEYATVNLSRLLSPRVLRQDTDYIAAVVPTTDVGVRGGLGLTGGTLEPAWTAASNDPVRLPVFDSWEFRTGPDGDFATIALRLQGVVAPYEVGRRFIDASQPGRPLDPLPAGAPGGKQVLRCALFSPSPPRTPEQATAETAVWPDSMVSDLRTELDLPARIEGAEEQVDGVPALPIVGPRIYAKLHRGSAVITGDDWFAEVNLAPTKRIVAGLGTRVVQRDQEQLMQAAWAQLGEVEKANRAIRLAQLAELLADRLHARLGDLQAGRLLQFVAPLATRVAPTAGRTLAADIAASATPTTAVSGAFRRVTRPAGPVLRRADASMRDRAGALVGSDAAMRDFTRTYQNPDGVGSLSTTSITALDPAAVAAAVDIPVDQVTDVLSQASQAMGGGIATLLTEPAGWQAPAAGFDVAGSVVERWSASVLREPSNPAVAEIRAQRVAPLAAELARTTVAGEHREALERQAVTLNNELIERLVARPVDGGVIAGGRVDGGVIGGVRVDPRLRANPIGGAVGRLRGVGVRRPAAGIGRVAVEGVRGLRQIDASTLQLVTAQSTPEARSRALASLADLAEVKVTGVLDRMGQLGADALRADMTVLVDPGDLLAIAKVPRPAAMTVDAVAAVATVLDPARTVRAELNGRVRLSDALRGPWLARPFITPIMAAPHFDRPMYQALNDYSRDWLVPGLGLLPADDFVTVLSTNSEFMEAFFIGLSDEMGHELLWRNYPTDQRGTYFRRFWDKDADELTQQIHAFSRTPLSSHISVGGTGGNGPRAVIVVKSELVRRYPDLIIQTVKNQGTVADPVFERVGSPQQTAEQLFAAYLEPDIALIGVNLGIDEIDQPEWWILIAEHPTATRFDRPRDANLPPGQQFLAVPQASESATFAKLRLHDPVRVAFQATDLIVTGA